MKNCFTREAVPEWILRGKCFLATSIFKLEADTPPFFIAGTPPPQARASLLIVLAAIEPL
eukprot:gene24845-10499_t